MSAMKKMLFVSDRYPLLKLRECVIIEEMRGGGRMILFTKQKVEFERSARGTKGGPQLVSGKVVVSDDTLPQFLVHASELADP